MADFCAQQRLSVLLSHISGRELSPTLISSSRTCQYAAIRQQQCGSSTHDTSASTNISIPAETVQELREKYAYPREDRFQLTGLNHLALVSSDMKRTVEFYSGILGLPLTKTIELPDGGQHFFFDIGAGESLAFFWFPSAPPSAPGVASVHPDVMKTGQFTTAHGSMNHVAFNVAEDMVPIYRNRLKQHGVQVSPILYHADNPIGYSMGKDETTHFVSVYFWGPDGEYLEFASQLRGFSPERDIEHMPKTSDDAEEM